MLQITNLKDQFITNIKLNGPKDAFCHVFLYFLNGTNNNNTVKKIY
jgi:hypothetical protein